MGCGDVCLLNDEGSRAIEGSSRPPLINLTVPPQGLGVDTGHVIATFPALYACAWICARERRHTTIAAGLLSAHLGFWRMVLDTRFVNWTLSL